MAGPSWGWHQLDSKWANQLVADAALRRGATVIDVGAGTGAVTAPLVDAGLRVIAIELHPQRCGALAERFGDDVTLVRTDARDLRLPRYPFHVVASPPYAVTTALLRRLLHPGSRLVSAHLVLQEQTARRWASRDAPAWSRWSRTFAASLGRPIPRHAFRPSPRVDNRVLVIRRL